MQQKFSTVCPVCFNFMRKKNSRTYECQCGNWLFVLEDPYGGEAYLQYRSDIEAPASFYPRSNDLYPGYCRDCSDRFLCNRKYCTYLG